MGGTGGTAIGGASGGLGTTSQLGGGVSGTNRGTGTGSLSNTNPFGSYYRNVLASGMSSFSYFTIQSTPFGQPDYNSTGLSGGTGSTIGGGRGTTGLTSTTSGFRVGGGSTSPFGGGGRAGVTGVGGGAGVLGSVPFGSSAGMFREPQYGSVLSWDPAFQPVLTLQPTFQAVIDRASNLPSRARIRVLTDGETIVLRGKVRDDHERRMAEGLLRLTPGVRRLVNQLELANPG
jgi:hypothetical protein